MPESGPQEFGNSSYLGCLLVSQLDRLARRALHAAARTPSELREVLTQLWEESEESQRSTALKVAARTAEAGLHMVPYDDERYPAVLREIDDPPYVLWVRCRAESQLAQLPALSMVAVVGSRRADAEGTAIARESGAYLASCGATVVSGLAFGIDAAAHRGALQTTLQCPTIAVLACGLDRVYPAAHRSLAAQILDSGGMLVSHFPPGTEPFPAHFLDRNRIITGLSAGTLIVQATERSGALASARFTIEQNRELCVVPGSINAPLYAGSNELLKHGAHPVTRISDLRGIFPFLREPLRHEDEQRTTEACEAMLALLPPGRVQELREVAAVYPYPDQLHEVLYELELSGVVQRLPGNRLQRISSLRADQPHRG